jgi:tetratricopeptide (TPR) repeat protein
VAAVIYEEIDDARAFELCEKARKIVEQIIAVDPANVQARHNLAMSFSRLGVSASNLGNQDEALAYLERGAAILSELQVRDPLNRGYDSDSSSLQTRIGGAKYKRRDLAGALEAYEKSRASLEKQIKGDPANTRGLRNMALSCRDLGWVHGDYIKTTTGQARQHHLEAAMVNYRRALNTLLKLEKDKALTEFDRKTLEEVRAAVEELEKNR